MASSKAHLVLVACAEPFAAGGRALVFGSAASGLAEELVERGSRLVHVYDPDALRARAVAVENRARQIVVAPLDDADGALKPGAFDVALVPDVTLFDAPSTVVGLVKRALSSRGVAFLGAPNVEAKTALFGAPDAERRTPLGYYELYDVVSAAFPEVVMLGQTPFVGYAVVDFAAEGDLDVSIDSELVPGGAEEPEWFLSCASAERTFLGAIQLVQLPASMLVTSEPAPALPPAPDPTTLEELRAARAAEAHLIDRVARLEVELAQAQAELSAARAAAFPKEKASELERELSLRDERLAAAQTELSGLQARARDAERLETEKRDLEGRLEQKSRELGALTEVAEADGPDDTERLEALLAEQGQRVRQLEADLAEAARVGTDLVHELGRRRARSAEPETPELARENARLKADLEAASWTITELEGRLPESSSS